MYTLTPGDGSVRVTADAPATLTLGLQCTATFASTVVLALFAEDENSGTVYEPAVAAVAVACDAPGCGTDDACSGHGVCTRATGSCTCAAPWSGAACAAVLESTKRAYCPGESIELRVALAAATGDEWYSLFDEATELVVYDWNYLATVLADTHADARGETLVAGAPLPRAGDGSTVGIHIPNVVPPGALKIELYADNAYTLLTAAHLEVLPYTDARCNGTAATTCAAAGCSGRGTCDAATGLCACDSARHFWYDCSRGCDELTTLTAPAGVVDSDPSAAAAPGRAPLYNTNAVCTWVIAPRGARFDAITLHFERFEVTNGDTVRIVTVNDDNRVDDASIVLDSFSGYALPADISYAERAVAVVLTADYTSSGSGVRLAYNTTRSPLGAGPITGIAVAATAAVLAALALLVWLVVHRRVRRAAEVAAARRARSVPMTPAEMEAVRALCGSRTHNGLSTSSTTTTAATVTAATTATATATAATATSNDGAANEDDDDEHHIVEVDNSSLLVSARPAPVADASNDSNKKTKKSRKSLQKEHGDGSSSNNKDRTNTTGTGTGTGTATSKSGGGGNGGTAERPEPAMDDETLGWTKLGEHSGLEVTAHVLHFGLEARAAFPVMEDETEQVLFTNTASRPLQFRISHPVDEHAYECYAEPGMGTLLPGYGVRVVFHFRLKYTTRVVAHFGVAVWNNSAGSTVAGFCGFAVPDGRAPDAVARVGVALEGAMSERLDPNEIVLSSEPLGVGAFGVVYPGQYRQTLVAVKVMSRQQDLLEHIVGEFEKEIELYRKLRNPLLVEFVGASLVPGRLCMCTELITHGSLEQLVSETAVPFALQTKFALNIAEAVAYLHASNVLYRDLKPSNVMIVSTSLSSKVNCKIGDFGTARNVKDVTELFTYTTGQGTPIYMAPEILDVRPYNNKADVYSFAITLWQVFCREKPWNRTPVWNIPTLVVAGQRPECPAAMPADYAALIRRCWSPSIDARPDFQTVLTLLLPIAKRAKRDFKASPTAEQQLRRVQAAAAAGPAAAAAAAVAAAAAGGGAGAGGASSAGGGSSGAHVRRGVLAAVVGTERGVFTLGLNDVSRTATSATSAGNRTGPGAAGATGGAGATATASTSSSSLSHRANTATASSATATGGVPPPQSQLTKNTSLQPDTTATSSSSKKRHNDK